MNDKELNIVDCWNKIGVWRKHEEICPKLASVIHCRNCDTYISAGLKLLDRGLPDNYTAENTESYKQEKSEQSENLLSCIIFRTGAEWYAIRSSILSEICETSEVHSIPHNRQEIIAGLVNIRGEIEICISFSALSAMQSSGKDSTAKARMMIINLDSGKYAYQADEVMGIYKIKESTIKHTPSTISATGTHLIEGVFDFKDTPIGLIDSLLMNHRLIEVLS